MNPLTDKPSFLVLAGFIATDGHIKASNCIEIAQSTRITDATDINIGKENLINSIACWLTKSNIEENLKVDVKPYRATKPNNTGVIPESLKVIVYSREIKELCIQLGLGVDKTYNICPQTFDALVRNLTEKQFLNFMLGYFFGDGCLSQGKDGSFSCYICGQSGETMEWIGKYFENKYNIPFKIYNRLKPDEPSAINGFGEEHRVMWTKQVEIYRVMKLLFDSYKNNDIDFKGLKKYKNWLDLENKIRWTDLCEYHMKEAFHYLDKYGGKVHSITYEGMSVTLRNAVKKENEYWKEKMWDQYFDFYSMEQ